MSHPLPSWQPRALPASRSTGQEGTWLQIVWLEWQGVWSCVGLGSLLSLPGVGSAANQGPKGSMGSQSGCRGVRLPHRDGRSGGVQSQQPRPLASQTLAVAGAGSLP